MSCSHRYEWIIFAANGGVILLLWMLRLWYCGSDVWNEMCWATTWACKWTVSTAHITIKTHFTVSCSGKHSTKLISPSDAYRRDLQCLKMKIIESNDVLLFCWCLVGSCMASTCNPSFGSSAVEGDWQQASISSYFHSPVSFSQNICELSSCHQMLY